jgi:hypothetical protein
MDCHVVPAQKLGLGRQSRPLGLEITRDLARAFLMQSLFMVLPPDFLNSGGKSNHDVGSDFHHFGCFSSLTH